MVATTRTRLHMAHGNTRYNGGDDADHANHQPIVLPTKLIEEMLQGTTQESDGTIQTVTTNLVFDCRAGTCTVRGLGNDSLDGPYRIDNGKLDVCSSNNKWTVRWTQVYQVYRLPCHVCCLFRKFLQTAIRRRQPCILHHGDRTQGLSQHERE